MDSNTAAPHNVHAVDEFYSSPEHELAELYHLIEQPAWHALALCALGIEDSKLWFSRKGEDIARAKDVCRTCPVKSPCYDAAVDRDEKNGIWGGVRFDPLP